MNSKIFAALALFAVSVTVCAQVQLTNLDQKSFKIDVTGQPTNVVNIFLRSTQFSPSTTGWVLTNVSGVYGISTNISTNDIWTIDGFGDIHPAVTNNQVTVTNLVVGGNLTALGTLNLFKKSQLLSLGTNVLGSGVSTMFYCVSPTNDASQVILSLNDGSAPGQLLLIVNYTNAVPANGAFTLPKNSLVSGGGHVIQPEDWIATNTFAALYTWQAPDWLMIDAFAANGQSVFQTNYFQNIVVYSNITLRGNSTLTINNITLTTNDLWHTNVVVGVATNLQPVNLRLQPMIHLPLVVGTNAESFTTPTGGEALIAIRDVNKGESDGTTLILNTRNGASAVNGSAQLDAETFGANLYLTSATNGGSLLLQGSVLTNGITLTARDNVHGVDLFHLTPNVNPTTTPYYFSTDRTHTGGNILEVDNNSTNLFSIDYLGEAVFGPGTTNIIYRQNGYFAIAADEGGYSLLNFGTNYGTLSAYVGSSPLGGTLATTGGQLDFGVSSGQLTYDGSTLTPRTSNTVKLASSINPWVDIYLHDGLHIGTNTLTSNGSSPSSPLWNGSALGGGGGNMTNTGAAVVGMVPVATDTSGGSWTPTNALNLNSLQVKGSPVLSLTNYFGGSAHFVASNSNYLSCASNTNLQAQVMTLTAWCYIDAMSGGIGNMVIAAKDDDQTTAGSEYWMGIVKSNTNIYFQIEGTSTRVAASTYFQPAYIAPYRTWIFVVGMYDGTNVMVQVDNDITNSTAMIGSLHATSTPFSIGADVATNGVSGSWFNGRIDSVGLWSRVLTTAERTSLYNAGHGVRYSDLTASIKTNLTSWWDLDEFTGTRADSFSTNNLSDSNGVGLTPPVALNPTVNVTTGTATNAGPFVVLENAAPNSIRLTPTGTSINGGNTTGASYGVIVGTTSGSQGIGAVTTDFAIGSTGSALRMGPGATTGNTYSIIDSLTTGATVYGTLTLQQGSAGKVGIGTTAPTSGFHIANSFAHSFASGSAFTLTDTNEVYFVTTDAQLISVPTAVGHKGRVYTVKTVSPASTATLTNVVGTQTFDGALSYSLSASNKFVTIISDNVNWWIIGNN